ncbi:MAG TPA: hypothetical protein DGQ94_19165 [Pseudomonas sp.]|nr:hypothetical protein [Pseudomonas sp.]
MRPAEYWGRFAPLRGQARSHGYSDSLGGAGLPAKGRKAAPQPQESQCRNCPPTGSTAPPTARSGPWQRP